MTVSYIGASFAVFGVGVVDPDGLARLLLRPLEGTKGLGGKADGLVRYLALPLLGYSPIVHPISDLYEPSGALAFLPQGWYWLLVNLAYWVFWANAMVGLANSLPSLPFDGGFVLRDAIKGLARTIKRSLTGLDKDVGRRAPSDDKIDSVMLFFSVLVGFALAALVLSKLL